jgi:hypothetical protein
MRGSSLLVDRTLVGIANEWQMVSTRRSSLERVVSSNDGGKVHSRGYSPPREASFSNKRQLTRAHGSNQ